MSDISPSKNNFFALEQRTSLSVLDIAVATGSLLTTTLAFGLNLGWFRAILMMMLIPLGLVLLYVVLTAVVFFKRIKSKVFYGISLLHPASYAILADFSDTGSTTLFFGLISLSQDSNVQLFSYLGLSGLGLTFLFSLGLLIQVGVHKRRQPEDIEPA